MMSDHDFDMRWKHILDQHAARRQGADAYLDQEAGKLAALAQQEKWTQERIAAHMGKPQSWVSRRLLFGRFLNFMPTGHNPDFDPRSLTERRFRTHWEKVGKGRQKETEEGRFARVLESLLQHPNEPSIGNYANLINKPGIKPAVVEVLKEGRRRTNAEIAAIVTQTIPNTGAAQVAEAVEAIKKNPPKGFALDTRPTEKAHKHRLVPCKMGTPNPFRVAPERAGEITASLLPKLDAVIKECQKSHAAMSLSFVIHEVWEVKKALEALMTSAGVVA